MLLDRTALGRLVMEVAPETGPCTGFAAAELRRYLVALGGVEVALRARPELSGAVIRLGDAPTLETPRGESLRIAAGERGITLAGGSPNALLRAVYRLLEDLGCSWSWPGGEHELVEPLPSVGVRVADRHEEPAYRVRAYATDIHTYHYSDPEVMAERLPADVAFTDWMGKSGANAFLFIRHPFDTKLTISQLLPELEKRGIAAEYGGHVLPLLLPRERFAEYPEWFPVDAEGRRTDLGNLCTSSRAALAMVAAAAVSYAEQYPEMRVLHIWGADLWEGGWCRCGECAEVRVQDQSLRVCNAVAEALARAGRPLGVCYLAYHDTIEADLHLRPHENVLVEFAPRERCYGHALDDPACDINPRYRQAFERYVEIFDGRVRVFEYYGDAILFCGIAVPLTAVIEADLRYYRAAGAREISFLQFGEYSLWAHPLNFLAFAEGVTRPVPTSTRAHGEGGTPKHSRAPWGAYDRQFWTDLESAIAGVVTYGDVRRPPRRRAAQIGPRVERAVAELRACIAQLRHDPMEQRALLEYTAAVLEGVALQLAGAAGAAGEAEARFQRALDLLTAVDPRYVGVWGRRNLPVIHSFHSAAWRRS